LIFLAFQMRTLAILQVFGVERVDERFNAVSFGC